MPSSVRSRRRPRTVSMIAIRSSSFQAVSHMGAYVSGYRHEPDAHLGDDSEVRLHEQTPPARARTPAWPFLATPRGSRHGAHPVRSTSPRQTRAPSHSAGKWSPMGCTRHHGLGYCRDAAAADVRDRPHSGSPSPDRFVQVKICAPPAPPPVRHSSLISRISVHPRRLTDTDPRTRGEGAAIPLLRPRDIGVDGDLVLVSPAHHGLDFLGRARLNDRRGVVLGPVRVARTGHGTRAPASPVSTCSAPTTARNASSAPLELRARQIPHLPPLHSRSLLRCHRARLASARDSYQKSAPIWVTIDKTYGGYRRGGNDATGAASTRPRQAPNGAQPIA